jgi:hypothetical protein
MRNGLDKLKIGEGGADDDEECKMVEAEESDRKLLSALW